MDDGVRSEAELAAEAEATTVDVDEHWDEQPEQIEVKRRTSEVVSFRLPSDEFDRLEDAASASGETVSQFIRNAIALRLEGQVFVAPSLDWVGSGVMTFIVRNLYGGSSTEVEPVDSFVELPDYPPLTVQGPVRRMPVAGNK